MRSFLVTTCIFGAESLMNRGGFQVLDDELSAPVHNASQAKIPKIVHLTALTYPYAVVANNKLYMENGTEFRFYDDAAMDKSAQQIGEELARIENVTGAYEAFSNLRPMAFRADLWRYMVLWKHGGVYMDDKLMLTNHSTSWLDRYGDELVTVRDRFPDAQTGRDVYWNGLIASVPRSPHMVNVIRHTVSNIKSKLYSGVGGRSNWCLYITGPGALTTGLGSFKPKLALSLRRVEDMYPIKDIDKHRTEPWHRVIKRDPGAHFFGFGRFKVRIPYLFQQVKTEPAVMGLARGSDHHASDDILVNLEFIGADNATRIISNAGVHAHSGASFYDVLCKEHRVYCDDYLLKGDSPTGPNPCSAYQELADLRVNLDPWA